MPVSVLATVNPDPIMNRSTVRGILDRRSRDRVGSWLLTNAMARQISEASVLLLYMRKPIRKVTIQKAVMPNVSVVPISAGPRFSSMAGL